MTGDLSQVTAMNNSLNRECQSLHDDLVSAQSLAQRYKEDAGRLLREVSLLRDEVILLRNRVRIFREKDVDANTHM